MTTKRVEFDEENIRMIGSEQGVFGEICFGQPWTRGQNETRGKLMNCIFVVDSS